MAGSAVSTGVLTAGGTLVFNGVSYLNSIQVFTDGTNAATVTVYDNTSAAGKIVAQAVVPGANLYVSFPAKFAIRCDVALFVQVTGTGASGIVTYGAMG